MDTAEIFKALADTNRLRILHLLGTRTLCVCDLEAVLELKQSNLSRHLSRLKQAGLVKASKKGQFMYYTRQPVGGVYQHVVDELYRTMETDPVWEADRQSLAGRLGCC